jgi:CheY-like chemotaxis protein
MTVLLVEDDALIRMNTAEMLQDSGFIVVEAGSAEDARAALQTMAVDFLVTDLNLPGASGTELAAEARALRPSTMIVFATGDPSSVRDQSGSVVLAKPYDETKLAAALASAKARQFDGASLTHSDTGEQEEA